MSPVSEIRARTRESCVKNTRHISNDFLVLSKLVMQVDFRSWHVDRLILKLPRYVAITVRSDSSPDALDSST